MFYAIHIWEANLSVSHSIKHGFIVYNLDTLREDLTAYLAGVGSKFLFRLYSARTGYFNFYIIVLIHMVIETDFFCVLGRDMRKFG